MCLGLSACGGEADPDAGTNGLGKLSAPKIQSRTVQAAQGAKAVRLSGTVVSGGNSYKIDMRLKDEGGSGSVTTEGRTFRLLRVGEHLFLKADAEFWTHQDAKGSGSTSQAGSSAADKLDDKYVKVPQGDPAYQRLSGFTVKGALLDGLLALHGKVSKGDRGSVSGVRTVELTGDKGAGGTLAVSLEGSPYPLSLKRGGGAGTLQLSDWGKDFALSEPADADTVDYGAQLPES
ncbi:hypothetical protein [Streptomyces sp. NPDC046821]|uniref:hypothetical protein n=1 Tax=Streptomyces sp. NPDC046821 TaxID=3154702 RepID=UPI0033EC3BDD